MKYTTGDRVKIKTWEEMMEAFENRPLGFECFWNSDCEKLLPKNRIITLGEIYSNTYCWTVGYKNHYVCDDLIKSKATLLGWIAPLKLLMMLKNKVKNIITKGK